MGIQVFPGFKEIFPDQEEDNIENIVKKVSSVEILKLLSKINRDLFLDRNNTDVSENIFYELCDSINESDRSKIIDNYKNFKQEKRNHNPNVIIFLEVTILDLMIEVFRNVNYLEFNNTDKELLSITVLKGVLISNSRYDKKLYSKFPEGINPNSNFITGIHQYNYSSPRDPLYIVNLSSEFFTYLINNNKLKSYLYEFLGTMKIDNYRQYINVIASSAFEILMQKNYRLTLNNFFEYPSKYILDSVSIDFTQGSTIKLPTNFDRDYKLLREKPIIKLIDGSYCILDQNLLLDKLYIGLFFNLYNNTSLKDNKLLYKKFDDFLSDLGLDFAEKQLFYKVIPNCFLNKEKSILISGDAYQFEYSDYYVRENDSILLFEFKNYIINADVKNSLDRNKIIKEIVSKAYEEEVKNKKGEIIKIKSKGVKQLINSIIQINEGGFKFDPVKNVTNERLYVYPILVYTDEFFDVNGMHQILDEYYKNELKNLSITDHQINRLILISLYDLIRISYTINKRKISLVFLLDLYHERINQLLLSSRDKNLNFIIPHFSKLIHDQLLDVDLATIQALFHDILGNGFEVMTGLIFDETNKDKID